MKKLLSIMLVLLMALTVFACTNTPAQPDKPAEPDKPVEQPTEAPAEPDAPVEPDTPVEPDVPAVEYEGLGLQLKNKTGLTIKAMYIYPVGEEMGNSVVEAGWQDKDADPEGYEKYIYIVREAGKEMEVTVVFEDETKAVWQVGALAMYDELSLKKGADVANWEHEVLDKDEDKMMVDFVVARGKTDDNFYPGYELIPVELKNKTGKNITGLWFYEEDGNPEAYNNMIDYLYTPEGVKMESLMPGKAKEGGMYLFKCFIRPHTDNYYIYVTFDDGTDITYPIEDWFKPDGDGHLPNEISLKNAEDKYDIKVQYDDGVPEPIDYLAESLEKGYIVDQWYPTYATVNMDADTVKALRAALAAIPVPAVDEPAEPAEPAEPDQPAEPDAPAAEIPEGYTGISMLIKNKTGKDIEKIYLFPNGEDKGKNVFKTLIEVLPTEDESVEGDPHEVYAYVLRETEKLGAMTLRIRFMDGEELDYELENPVENHMKFSLKEDSLKQEVEDDPEDIAAMDALAALGAPTDDVWPEAAADEPAEEPANEPTGELPAGYIGLALNVKNKTGVTIKGLYFYTPGAEGPGNNLLAEDWLDKDADEENYEKYIYIIRPEGALTVEVEYEDGSKASLEVTLNQFDKISFKGVAAEDWKIEANDDPEDIAKMEALLTEGVTTDNWYPEA